MPLRSILVLVFTSAVLGPPQDLANSSLALVGGTIYVSPTEECLRDGVVLIRGEKIVAVGSRELLTAPEPVRTVDCTGLTITAGFWNCHVHFFERKWANAASIPAAELARQLEDMITRYGFTSVFDLSSAWENTRRIRDRVESGEVLGPSIRSTGQGLVGPGALPSDQVLGLMGLMKASIPELADAAAVEAATKQLLAAGVDGIKVFLKAASPGGPSFPEGGLQIAVEEAHRAGKPVFAHPSSGADVLAAIRGDVDVIAHTTPQSGPWDETILAAVKERERVALTPTLMLWKYFARHDRASTQEESVRTSLGQLRAWLAAGGTVLFGTDLGAAEYDPAEEYALMAEAGMSFRQILESLTTAPAEQFGASRRLGRVAAGLQADLAILRQDPATNVRALAGAQYTLRAGKIIHRAGE
jgi:imidazolonepropionase-like amidohydrolase